MAVYDVCPFLDENDLYELRLHQHWDYVDRFIVVEGGETHTGLKKPFNFDQKRFEKYKSKLSYIKFESFEEEIVKYPYLLDTLSLRDRSPDGQFTPDWIRCDFHGNYPVEVLRQFGARGNDIVYISSLDEIVSPKGFEEGLARFSDPNQLLQAYAGCGHGIKEALVHPEQCLGTKCDAVHLWQAHENDKIVLPPVLHPPSFGMRVETYVYKYNLHHTTAFEVGQMTQFKSFFKMLPASARHAGIHTHPSIEKGGWHFSWMDKQGEQVLNKQRSWAHSKDNVGEHNPTDPIFKVVNITEESHPKYLVDNLEQYEDYILKGDAAEYKAQLLDHLYSGFDWKRKVVISNGSL